MATDNEAGQFVIPDGPPLVSFAVSFGPEAHQSVHLETAERMLTGLAAQHPNIFKALYGAAVLGDK